MTTLVPVSQEPFGYTGEGDGGQAIFFDLGPLVLSQYASSPVIMALVASINQVFDRQSQFDEFFDALWNVDSATGYGLDVWGRRVGVSRALYVDTEQYLGFSQADDAETYGHGILYGAGNFTTNYNLSDDAYRLLILAKAALNITNASVPAINAILMAIFPSYGNSYVRDNLDMTMTYVFGASLSLVDYAIISQAGVIPKPIGVSFSVEQP